MEIYLQQDGQQTGPFTEEQLQQSVASKAINPFDLAKHEGINEWRPLCTLIHIATASPDIPNPGSPDPGEPHLSTQASPSASAPGASNLPPPTLGTEPFNSPLPPPDFAPASGPSAAGAQEPVLSGGRARVIQAFGEQGAMIAGWAFFLIGCIVLIASSGPFYIHYALFVIASILSIEVLFQHRVLAGLSLLLTTLIVPGFIGLSLLFYQINYSEDSVADENGKMQAVEKTR